MSSATAARHRRLDRIRTTGITANRDLALVGHLFRWAVRKEHAERTPFKNGTETVVPLQAEAPRRRRLHAGEAESLLAARHEHLRALLEAALETGCRRGELLSLQRWQVRFEPKGEIFLPAKKTKTKRDRKIPISTRLKPILEMRRNGPDGKELPGTAYVFGDEVGDQVKNVKRAWERAVLKVHGYKPTYVVRTTGEGRVRLRAIDLHFPDLRREAG